MLETFPARFDNAYRPLMRRKIGITNARDGDNELVDDLLARMAEGSADFTNTFRGLCGMAAMTGAGDSAGEHASTDTVRSLFKDPNAFDDWAKRWTLRLADDDRSATARAEGMRAENPAFIPRNHRVEAVIRAAIDEDDLVRGAKQEIGRDERLPGRRGEASQLRDKHFQRTQRGLFQIHAAAQSSQTQQCRCRHPIA